MANDNRHVIAVADPAELAKMAAERVVARISANPGRAAICLTGGSSPQQLYRLLATDTYRSRIAWDHVHWFIGDDRFVATGDPLSNNKSVLVVDNVTDFRLPSASSLDARIEKAFKIQRVNILFDLDVFNLTNSATVLGKQYNLRATGATGFDQVLEIMNPRILRLGGRINF